MGEHAEKLLVAQEEQPREHRALGVHVVVQAALDHLQVVRADLEVAVHLVRRELGDVGPRACALGHAHPEAAHVLEGLRLERHGLADVRQHALNAKQHVDGLGHALQAVHPPLRLRVEVVVERRMADRVQDTFVLFQHLEDGVAVAHELEAARESHLGRQCLCVDVLERVLLARLRRGRHSVASLGVLLQSLQYQEIALPLGAEALQRLLDGVLLGGLLRHLGNGREVPLELHGAPHVVQRGVRMHVVSQGRVGGVRGRGQAEEAHLAALRQLGPVPLPQPRLAQ
eukprot:scaffold736_cov254-Pinguiococcus_pyrenoidosus.AAC.27